MNRFLPGLLVLFVGCSGFPRHIGELEVYPDRSTPANCFLTYIRATREGDLETIERCVGYFMALEFRAARKALGDEALKEKLREASKRRDYRIQAVHLSDRRSLAYLDVQVRPTSEEPQNYVFSLLNEGGRWKLTIYELGTFEHEPIGTREETIETEETE